MKKNIMYKFHLRILNKIHKNPKRALHKIETIDRLNESEAKKILTILLEYACKSENTALIMISRDFIKKMPLSWLSNHFLDTATACIDFDDEWEYYRIVEVIENAIPEFFDWVIQIGLKSDTPEVIEAAEDFLETHS